MNIFLNLKKLKIAHIKTLLRLLTYLELDLCQTNYLIMNSLREVSNDFFLKKELTGQARNTVFMKASYLYIFSLTLENKADVCYCLTFVSHCLK